MQPYIPFDAVAQSREALFRPQAPEPERSQLDTSKNLAKSWHSSMTFMDVAQKQQNIYPNRPHPTGRFGQAPWPKVLLGAK